MRSARNRDLRLLLLAGAAGVLLGAAEGEVQRIDAPIAS